jgi:hypothetical protein
MAMAEINPDLVAQRRRRMDGGEIVRPLRRARLKPGSIQSTEDRHRAGIPLCETPGHSAVPRSSNV